MVKLSKLAGRPKRWTRAALAFSPACVHHSQPVRVARRTVAAGSVVPLGREHFERCSEALRDRAAFELRRIRRMAWRLRWLQSILDVIGTKTAVTLSVRESHRKPDTLGRAADQVYD